MIEHNKVCLKKPDPIDWQYLKSLEPTLHEWDSPEDHEAYDDL
jgi:hypothetical protein